MMGEKLPPELAFDPANDDMEDHYEEGELAELQAFLETKLANPDSSSVQHLAEAFLDRRPPMPLRDLNIRHLVLESTRDDIGRLVRNCFPQRLIVARHGETFIICRSDATIAELKAEAERAEKAQPQLNAEAAMLATIANLAPAGETLAKD